MFRLYKEVQEQVLALETELEKAASDRDRIEIEYNKRVMSWQRMRKNLNQNLCVNFLSTVIAILKMTLSRIHTQNAQAVIPRLPTLKPLPLQFWP